MERCRRLLKVSHRSQHNSTQVTRAARAQLLELPGEGSLRV